MALGCAAVMACEPEMGEDNGEEIVFPEYQEHTVARGEEFTYAFEAPVDWEVSVPDNGIQWFWIKDGEFKNYKVKGKAGANTVVIAVSDVEEFDVDRSCVVTMTMNGKSQEVIKLTRPSLSRTLALSVAEVVDGEIKYNEDGSSYNYLEGEPSEIELVWAGSDFRLPVKINANFNWSYEGPEWLEIDVPADGAVENEVILFGVPSKYPLADSNGALKFTYEGKVIKEYQVKIPGCEDIFTFQMDMGLNELQFNYKGQYKVTTGYIGGPDSEMPYATGMFFGTADARVFVLSKTDDGYSAEEPSWFSLAVSEFDSTEGAHVLQERTLSAGAELNLGDNRYAAMFVLPPYVDGNAEDLFEGAEIKEEYLPYMIPVTQLSSDQEYIAMLSNPSEVADAGATFVVSEDEALYSMFGQSRYAYELTYTNQYARDNARMMFTSEAASYKVFDESGAEMTGSEGFFLTFTLDDDMLGGVVDMISETSASGYVVLYSADGIILAVVKCTFDPEEVIADVADIEFIGDSIGNSVLYGATLTDVTDDSTFKKYKDGTTPVYHLQYTQADAPMTISLPASIVSHDVNPYQFKDYIRVNNIIYDDENANPSGLGVITMVDGGVTIYMDMPEDRKEVNYMRGNINFRKKTKNSDESDLVVVLVCTLDLR